MNESWKSRRNQNETELRNLQWPIPLFPVNKEKEREATEREPISFLCLLILFLCIQSSEP